MEVDRLKCGTIVVYPYGMFSTTRWRIAREFGDGFEICAQLECIECPDKRGIGALKVAPLKSLIPERKGGQNDTR